MASATGSSPSRRGSRRRSVLLACVAALLAVCWVLGLASVETEPSPASATAPSQPSKPEVRIHAEGAAITLPLPDAESSPGAAVFQRLFWRRPGPSDRILQAATRTLSGAPAQASVRWYLLVEPSPELVRYLREENAFGLSAGRAVPVLEQAPDWFAFDASEVDVLRGVTGGMVLAFNRSSGLLYATDTGAGFAASVEPPPPAPRPAQGPVSVGRLPPTPPPIPTGP